MPTLRPDDRGDLLVSGAQQGAYGHPLPIDPAEQLLQRSYRSTLSQLCSGHCSRLQSYHHSVGWADDSTCSGCRSTNHTVAHLFICPTVHTSHGSSPQGYVDGTPPGSSIPCRASTFQRSASTVDWFWLLPSIAFIPTVGCLLFGLQRVPGPHHLHLSPSHFTRGLGIIFPLC